MQSPILEEAAHVVQLALTPVFLLSGVATLVSAFATRLARVVDQAEQLADMDNAHPEHRPQLRLLQWRSRALDLAVVSAALAGSLTCGAALVLFLGSILGAAGADLLFFLFGGAIILTIGSLACFVLEMLLTGRGIRRILEHTKNS